MDKLLQLMLDGEPLSAGQMGTILGLTREGLDEQLTELVDEAV